MYEAYFELTGRPFSSVTQVDRYHPAPSIETARQNLVRCVMRGTGIGLVIGAPGTGKTLLCQLLASSLSNDFARIVTSRGPLRSCRDLYRQLLHAVGRPFRGLDEGELRLELEDFLEAQEGPAGGILLLADDAHHLTRRVLDEIRLLSDRAHHGWPLVQTVLLGSELLEDHLNHPRLLSMNQRIVARCYLTPYTCQETRQYIQAQIGRVTKAPQPLFDDEAITLAHRLTEGVPRVINQLCDHALLTAFAVERDIVDKTILEIAWADLQQLPLPDGTMTCMDVDAPASDGNPPSPCGNDKDTVIEFGSLDEEGEDIVTETRQAEAPQPTAAENYETDGSVSEDSEAHNSEPNVAQEASVASAPRASEPVEPIAAEPSPAPAPPTLESPPREDLGRPCPARDTAPVCPPLGDPLGESFQEEEWVVGRTLGEAVSTLVTEFSTEDLSSQTPRSAAEFAQAVPPTEPSADANDHESIIPMSSASESERTAAPWPPSNDQTTESADPHDPLAERKHVDRVIQRMGVSTDKPSSLYLGTMPSSGPPAGERNRPRLDQEQADAPHIVPMHDQAAEVDHADGEDTDHVLRVERSYDELEDLRRPRTPVHPHQFDELFSRLRRSS